MKDFRALIEPFQQSFQIVIADTPELLEKAHRLRYEVFCREFQFEREENCPGGLERDVYDPHAVHCLILHRRSGLTAGCIRLVLTRADAPAAPLPIERYCGHSLRADDALLERLPRDRLCEISRLAVSGHLGSQVYDETECRVLPLVSFTLFLSVISLAIATGRRHSLAMMEPWLARNLQIVGFSFRQVGEVTEYHGPRAPFHYTLDQALADKERRPMLKQLFEFIDPIIAAEARRTGLTAIDETEAGFPDRPRPSVKFSDTLHLPLKRRYG